MTSGRFAGEQIMVKGTVTSGDDGNPLPGVNVLEKGTAHGTVTDINGHYEIIVSGPGAVLTYSFIGYETKEIPVGSKRTIDVVLEISKAQLSEVVVTGYGKGRIKRNRAFKRSEMVSPMVMEVADIEMEVEYDMDIAPPQFNTEGYAVIKENEFINPLQRPLSTFSIDVDAASYANIRRFLNNGQRPPVDAVRIEEMINYFKYDYPQPAEEQPFSVTTEIASCPWNENHKLVHIGLQGRIVPTDNLPPSNLVFLIDVSGSMQDRNKLPLLKSAFKMLTEQLRPNDRVAIVVYAGAAGLVLPSTPGNEKEKIMAAIDRLSAGGSTAGGAGLRLAYDVAKKNFVDGGNNRIILATDGDFNIGPSSNGEMYRLIEKKREEGVFMTVLGFGMGNYKDDKMEIIADKGNGNYAYIDNLQEARKVLVSEFGGTLFTIAKDVKIQIEFNPAKVQAYRLIGYENRKLKKEDFNDDKKDAGELGSGHTVTALYEIIPVGVKNEFEKDVDELKYQKSPMEKTAKNTSELMTLKLRYKAPDGDKSKLITMAVKDGHRKWEDTSDNFRWSAAVAAYGMLLRESKFAQGADLSLVARLANGAKGKDEEGYRREFVRLVKSSSFLTMK